MKTDDRTHDRTDARAITTLTIACTLVVLATALTGCNAVSGLGQDLQESSDNVSDAIEGDD